MLENFSCFLEKESLQIDTLGLNWENKTRTSQSPQTILSSHLFSSEIYYCHTVYHVIYDVVYYMQQRQSFILQKA